MRLKKKKTIRKSPKQLGVIRIQYIINTGKYASLIPRLIGSSDALNK